MRMPSPFAATALIAASLVAAGSTQVSAACTRLAFSVNDYGKEGPTNDAKNLLDKYIAKWTGEHQIAKYTTGKKDVSCELFLNFIVFDEHTCRAEATVCWDGPAVPGTTSASADGAEVPASAPVKKAAITTAAPAAPAKPKATAAAAPAIETGALPAAEKAAVEPIAPKTVSTPAVTAVAVPSPAVAPLAPAPSLSSPAAQSAIADQALAAAKKAADAAERAAAAAERAAAAATAAERNGAAAQTKP